MTATQAFRSNKLIQLIAVMGTSFLTGGFAVLIGFVVWTLVVNHRSMPVMHKTLFWASIIMFCISLVTLGLVMQELSTDPTPLANRQVQIVLSMLQYIISDFIIIWRVWIVWGRNYFIIIAPAAILVVGAGFGLNLLVTTESFFAVIPSALIVTNTSLCTILIAGRIWYVQRRALRSGILTGNVINNQYKRIMILVVESGALYTASAVLALILHLKRSVALPVMLNMETPLIGILPTLIIVLVHFDLITQPARPELRQADPILLHRSIHVTTDSSNSGYPILPNDGTPSQSPPKHNSNLYSMI